MKGFAITIDAIIALSLATLMFASILTVIPEASINNYNKKQLSNLGNDILAVMDGTGRLSYYVGQSSSFIQEELGYYLTFLPQTFCGNITLKIYSGNIGPPTSFSLVDSYSNQTQNCAKTNDFVKVKRMFINYENQRYGLTEFDLWLR